MKRLLFLILFISVFQLQAAENINGIVQSVVDGNTVEVITATNETLVVVLADIDCPELTQEFGEDARKHLQKIALNKEVIIQPKGKDRKGNTVAVLLVKGKIDARLELLKEGLAWTSEKNPVPELEEVRTSAEAKGRGLWRNENPIPPWIYRRQQSMMQPKSS